MRRKKVALVFALAALLLSACNERTVDPVDLITSAAEEQSTEEETTEAETETVEETTAAEKPSVEGETVTVYDYEVFDDAEPHKITYWTDGVTREYGTFQNLMIPEWGVERIALPSDSMQNELYHLKPGEKISAEDFSENLEYDDSVNYNGCYSIRDGFMEFRTWRVKFDIENPGDATPGDLFIAAYPFSDIENFQVNDKSITSLIDEDGTVDYLVTIVDKNHWADSETADYRYGGRVLIRPRGKVAHCVMFTCANLSKATYLLDYVFFNTLKLTDVDAITEGMVCERT